MKNFFTLLLLACLLSYNSAWAKDTVAPEVLQTRSQVVPMTDEEEEYEDFGIHTIDGITYHLFCEYENYRAQVQPYNVDEHYAGDIYVPDQVSYEGTTFMVVNAWDAFRDCPELTSLSIGVPAHVANNPQLKTLEIREGTTQFWDVRRCDALETVVYPQSMYEGPLPLFCKSLKTFIVKTDQQFMFHNIADDFLLWNSEQMPSLTDVYFHSDYPPLFCDLKDVTEVEANPNVVIHIPQGSRPAYQQTSWQAWNLKDDLPPAPTCVKWDYCGNLIEYAFGYEAEGIGVGRGDNNVEFAMCVPAHLIEAYNGCKVTKIEFHSPDISRNDFHHEEVEYVFLTQPGTDYLVKEPVATIRGAWNTVELTEPYVVTGDSLFVGYGRKQALSANWAGKDVVDDGFYLRVMGDDDSFEMANEVGIWQKHAGYQNQFNRALPLRFYIEGEKLPMDVLIRRTSLSTRQTEQNDDEQSVQRPAPMREQQSVPMCEQFSTPMREQFSAPNRQQSAGDAYFTISTGRSSTPKKTASRPIIRQTADGHMQLLVAVCSRVPEIIRSLTLNWSLNDIPQEDRHFETSLLPNHEGIFCIDLPEGIPGRSMRVNVEVAAINGQPDEIQANSNHTNALTLPVSTHYPRRLVMEEGTGTWCGWCTRGIESIRLAAEHYPDNFIAIALHSDDKMYPEDNSYDPIINFFPSFPNSLINRTTMEDPQWWTLRQKIEEMKDNADATIEATALFAAQDSSRVVVTTQTTFGFSDNGSTEYRVAYVVVEDEVGPYVQSNFYSSPEVEDNPDNYMNAWVHSDSRVRMTFNAVARTILPDWQGAAGCVPTVVQAGLTYTYSYEFALPKNIQQKKNIRIVTLLIDGTTGEIMNAAQMPVIYDELLSVGERFTGKQPLDVFNLTGVPILRSTHLQQRLPKGVYIIGRQKMVVQ